jgi:hypothetical protein
MEVEVFGSEANSNTQFIKADKRERLAMTCICCSSEQLIRSPAVLMPFIAKRVFDYEPVEITDDWGLRDIRTGVAYSLCNTVECAECGVLFLDYRFSEYELSRLYADYRGEEYNNLRIRFEPEYSVIASNYQERATYIVDIENYLRPWVPNDLAALDWGGDSGVNSCFRYTAKLLHIYDISGINVCSEATKVSLEECSLYPYDLISCCQVLEHVPYPDQVLSEIVKIMRTQTILYLEVPLEAIFQEQQTSLPRGRKKKHWHEHINFFSQKSLVKLVQSCGLEVLAEDTLPVSLGWRKSTVQMLICKLS